MSEAHPQTNAQLSVGHRGIKALLVCAWRTAMRNTDTRKGEISSAAAVPRFINCAAVLFRPAGSFMVAVRCCACPPSAASARTPCCLAQVPTAENLDSARSNVNNFAIPCPGLSWAWANRPSWLYLSGPGLLEAGIPG